MLTTSKSARGLSLIATVTATLMGCDKPAAIRVLDTPPAPPASLEVRAAPQQSAATLQQAAVTPPATPQPSTQDELSPASWRLRFFTSERPGCDAAYGGTQTEGDPCANVLLEVTGPRVTRTFLVAEEIPADCSAAEPETFKRRGAAAEAHCFNAGSGDDFSATVGPEGLRVFRSSWSDEEDGRPQWRKVLQIINDSDLERRAGVQQVGAGAPAVIQEQPPEPGPR